MAELNTFVCDVCGAQKRDVNHWWVVWTESGEFRCAEFDSDTWKGLKDGLARHQSLTSLAIACGEEDVQTLFSRWLQTRTFDSPRRES